ncbi:hypothetical protein Ptr902_09996 [Pyrenophora tritici-repentis]|nr:hypothetical protein Ptr902_09996 [Pyrenophora tritici-repentis]
MLRFDKVELKILCVRSPAELLNGGPGRLNDTLKLGLGVILAGLDVLIGIDVVSLKNGVRSAPEFVKGGPVEDAIRLEVDVTLTGGKVPLVTGVLSLKNGVQSAPVFVKGGPVDDEFRFGVGDALGVVELATEVELSKKDVRGASVLENRGPVEDVASKFDVVETETVGFDGVSDEEFKFRLDVGLERGGRMPSPPVENVVAVLA